MSGFVGFCQLGLLQSEVKMKMLSKRLALLSRKEEPSSVVGPQSGPKPLVSSNESKSFKSLDIETDKDEETS